MGGDGVMSGWDIGGMCVLTHIGTKGILSFS